MDRINEKIKMPIKNFGYFIFCFSMVFAPKIGSLDLSVIVPVILFPFLFKLKAKLPHSFRVLVAGLFYLIIYQILIQLLNENFDFTTIARLVKSLLVVIIMGLAFGNGSEHFHRKICSALLYALIFHSILILIGSFSPLVNDFYSIISENEKLKDYRSSGILAGFDMAGFLSIIGLLMQVFDVAKLKSKVIEVISSVILFCSCYFASRISVVIASVVFLFYFLKIIRNPSISVKFRIVLSFLLFSTLIYVAYEALVVLEATMSLGVIGVSDDVASEIALRSATQDSEKFLWQDMFFLPASSFEIFFGTGMETLDSDVGYVKEIFRYGFLGLFFALLVHVLFLRSIFGMARIAGYSSKHKSLVIIVFFLMLFLTLKNSYIFVRGIFPVFLILSASLIKFRK